MTVFGLKTSYFVDDVYVYFLFYDSTFGLKGKTKDCII